MTQALETGQSGPVKVEITVEVAESSFENLKQELLELFVEIPDDTRECVCLFLMRCLDDRSLLEIETKQQTADGAIHLVCSFRFSKFAREFFDAVRAGQAQRFIREVESHG